MFRQWHHIDTVWNHSPGMYVVIVPVLFLILLLSISYFIHYLAVYKRFGHAFSKISYCKNHPFKYLGLMVLVSAVWRSFMADICFSTCLLSSAFCTWVTLYVSHFHTTHTPNKPLFLFHMWSPDKECLSLLCLSETYVAKKYIWKYNRKHAVYSFINVVSLCFSVVNKHVQYVAIQIYQKMPFSNALFIKVNNTT